MSASADYHTRRRIRLDPQSYRQPGAICSVTIAVRDRQPVFADKEIARDAIRVLASHAAATGVPVYGYCVMPDHIHLVIGPAPTCDIVEFVGQYKNLVLRSAWRRGIVGSFWQKSFWDHFLRAEEQLEPLVEYVLNNPVRRGLVEDWRQYEYSGSLVLEMGEG